MFVAPAGMVTDLYKWTFFAPVAAPTVVSLLPINAHRVPVYPDWPVPQYQRRFMFVGGPIAVHPLSAKVGPFSKPPSPFGLIRVVWLKPKNDENNRIPRVIFFISNIYL